MILTFSKQEFVDRIIEGTKIHTLREDKTNRWKTGMKIHFWKGNPRNTKSNPHQFGEGVCTDVRFIEIDFEKDSIYILNRLDFENFKDGEVPNAIFIFDFKERNEFAQNDGFKNWNSLKEWFQRGKYYSPVFYGKIIYFDFNKP